MSRESRYPAGWTQARMSAAAAAILIAGLITEAPAAQFADAQPISTNTGSRPSYASAPCPNTIIRDLPQYDLGRE